MITTYQFDAWAVSMSRFGFRLILIRVAFVSASPCDTWIQMTTDKPEKHCMSLTAIRYNQPLNKGVHDAMCIVSFGHSTWS